MLKQLEHRYRQAMPVVIAAYAAGVVAMLFAFQATSIGELDRAGWSAIAILAAAIPLEQISYRYRTVVPVLVVLYILAFVAGFFLLNLRLSVEWVILTLIGAALISGRIVTFARDWAVFIVVLVAWQVTDGLAGLFHFPLHITPMIDADKIIGFGNVPAVWLQQHLFDPNHVTWLDVVSVMVYSFHFLLPLAAGFTLWLVNRKLYYRYAIAFSVAAVAGFATYVLYPAVPPWMAVMHCPNHGSWTCDATHYKHYLLWFKVMPAGVAGMVDSGRMTISEAIHQAHWVPGVHDVWNFTMAGWISKNHGNFAFGPLHMGFDQVGAIPSEHVMFPTLVFLFFRRQFGKFGYLVLLYVALVIFVIAYMGQHYVIDGVIGIIYASGVYLLVMHIAPWAWRTLRPERIPLTRAPDQPGRAEGPVAEPALAGDESLVPAGAAGGREDRSWK